jgi:hypothetical protein
MTPKQFTIYHYLLNRLALQLQLTDASVVRLAADIWLLSIEEQKWHHADVAVLVSEWTRRVGGQQNIPAYLRVLQAGDAIRFKAEDSVDRAERALKVE